MRTVNGAGGPHPPALVLGDIDLIRALAHGGTRSVVPMAPRDPTRFSRYVARALPLLDHWTEAEQYVDDLVEWGAAQPSPPVLFYQSDGDLLMVSRHRDRLATVFRFVIADAELVEDLVDKARFQRLAERLSLPVPPARVLRARGGPQQADSLAYPFIVKPLTRRGLSQLAGNAKAVRIDSAPEFERFWPHLAAAGVDALAQEHVMGAESSIVSYHAYVDASHATVAEFTGRKLRTYPVQFGHTTALTITHDEDVLRAGRRVVEALRLVGAVKADFKRAADGVLHLLEVNPRFNLWHLPAAVAGVNIPSLVYADLSSSPRPHQSAARAGVTWWHPRDYLHARARGGSAPLQCAWFAIRADSRHGLSARDPLPVVAEAVGRAGAWLRSRWDGRRRTSDDPAA